MSTIATPAVAAQDVWSGEAPLRKPRKKWTRFIRTAVFMKYYITNQKTKALRSV